MEYVPESSIPAVEGGQPVRADFLPLSKPFIGEAERKEILDTLESGWLSTGPRTKRFEEAMANYVGAKHALALNSCTAGLHLALAAAGIGEGDEVIAPSFTFPATINTIIHVGARPVLADITLDTYNIDPDAIEGLITPRTKAIIPVHYGGQPCDMDRIVGIARKHGLLVIEDAATAIGAKYKGAYVGSAPDRVAIFSFYANKVLTTGEGGMLLTGNDAIAERARILSLHGMNRDAWKRYSAAGSWYFEITEAGFKYNMSDMQAALGLCQLERLDWFIKRRAEICAEFDAAFAELPGIVRPVVSADVVHSRYIYPILVDETRLTIERNQFIDALKAENIGTSVHYIPAHLHPFYQQNFGYKRGDLPNTERAYDRLISIPLFPHMTDQDVADVIGAVTKIADYYAR